METKLNTDLSFLEECLINEGLRKWKSNSVTFPYSDYFYQIKIEDKIGIRYYVEFVHYPKIDNLQESWMVNCRLNDNKINLYISFVSAIDVQIHFIKVSTQEDMEKIFNKLNSIWCSVDSPYYEVF